MTQVGDTFRVWIVDAGDNLLFIAGATHADAGSTAAQEIDEIVGSMQIDSTIAFGRDQVALSSYLDEVDAVCSVATTRFRAAERASRITVARGNAVGWVFDDAEWSEAAVRISEEALAELRALAPPESILARMGELYSAMEAPLLVLGQVAAWASAGDTEQVEAVMSWRIELTHRKDRLVSSIADELSGRVLLSVAQRFQRVFQGCPVALPA
jgi:hypothetical protein